MPRAAAPRPSGRGGGPAAGSANPPAGPWLTGEMSLERTEEITVTEPARVLLAAHLAGGAARFIRVHVGRG